MFSRFSLIAAVAFATAFRATRLVAQDPQPVPALTAHVTDLTGTLDPHQKESLENDLTALEKAKGSQLGVLIVRTTQPEDIAAFGIRVADAWKLGRKGTEDGVILIVAIDDHRVRIEVGRGLEGAIPDAAAARVIREYIAPRFRQGDYYGGIRDATGALIKLINDEPLPAPLTEDRPGSEEGANSVLSALVAAWFVGLFFRRILGWLPLLPRGGIVGFVAGAVAWLVGGLLLVGIAGAILGLFLGLLSGGSGGVFARRGGWGGFGGGGGFGSGFGGGGGFSGGGGGFSGGSASGSW